jgi:hypothetical protein
MRVEEIDPLGPAIGEWLAVRNAATVYDRPDEPPLTIDEARGLGQGFGGTKHIVALARDETGKAVGSLDIDLPANDNLWWAMFVSWEGSSPDELLDGLLRLETQMSVDSPHGDYEVEEQLWTAERWRTMEQRVAEMRCRGYYAAAIEEESGRVAAYTVMSVTEDAPATGRQFATVVGREDRGHSLGLTVKLANLRQIRETSPSTQRIQSWNADTNEHMIRVNKLMGFEVQGQLIGWQRKLAPEL